MSKETKITNKLGEIWGYARVSTAQQHEDRQLVSSEDYGVNPTHIFIDKGVSGKTFNRPAYKKLLRIIRKGDIIVVKAIDRLGRNYQDIIDHWRMITQDIGCGIHVIDMPLLNTSGDPEDLLNKFITDMMLQVLSFVAQNERETTINRQREGIEAAKRRREIKIGRPKKPIPFDFWEIYLMWRSKEYQTNDLWRYCHEVWGMSSRTFYRRITEIDARYGDFTVPQLEKLILDKDLVMDGIPFDEERIEAGIGMYNRYVLHNPEKAHDELVKHKKKIEEEGDLSAEEEEAMRKAILSKRQKEFRDRFDIPDPEELEMPTELIRRPKAAPGSFAEEVNKHKKNAGMNQAISLVDNNPVIPDIRDRIDPQKPMKTVIVI